MTNCLQWNIPTGYTVTQKEITVSIDEAVEILKTRRRRQYISAFRSGYALFAELCKDVWRCPYCNYERPTTHMAAKLKSPGRNLPGLSRAQIEKWGSHQLSLFRKDDEKIIVNPAPVITGEQTCGKCGRKSLPSLSLRKVELSHNSQQIVIRAEVLGISELLAIPWAVKGTITIQFPIYETVTFDLHSGHTTVVLQSANDVCIAKHDITAQPCLWKKAVVYQLIRDNTAISRTLKRLFSGSFGGKLPFDKDELSPDKYILMTRFTGFPRQFYDAIPYVPGSFQIEESFTEIQQKLHSAEAALAVFKDSDLPKCKTVKRVFYSNPGLLFYLPECERFWRIIKDVNYFRALLTDENIFYVLSILHQRPRLFEYIGDYCRVKGIGAMLSVVTEGWQSSIGPAVDYCTMGESMRLAEQQRWKKRCDPGAEDTLGGEEYYGNAEWFEGFLSRKPMFSVPMKKPIADIANCVIDGFSFVWLRSGNDYYIAGKAMRNCLSRWRVMYNPVVTVKREDKVVAVIEVGPDGIHQVQGDRNSCISQVPGLQEAYEKWRKSFSLKDVRRTYQDPDF